MLYAHLPGKADLDLLGESIFEVLEQVGTVFQNDEILTALEEWGARVDRSSCVVTFPRRKLEVFVEEIRAERATSPTPGSVQFRSPELPSVTGSVAQFVYDDDLPGPRPGRREDLVQLVKLGNALHPDQPVGHAVILRAVPPLLEPLEAALVLAEYADDPDAPFAWDVRQIPYLEEMGHLLGKERWYSLGAVCMAHPLRFDKNVADRYVHMMREGLRPAGLTAMPVAGVSAPVTVEGYLVVTAAEFLASWVVGRALNPRIGLGGSIWAGTTDMKTGHVSYSAFDAMYYAIATFQFLRAWCGVTVLVGGGEYSASKAPGSYAALEKAYKAMTIAAFTGVHRGIGEGMLDNGKVLSAVQLLLDREFGLGVQHFGRPIVPTEERMALAEILEVGCGRSSHVMTDHTARWFRQSLWLPRLLARTGWTGAVDETALLALCRAEAHRLIAEARPPEGREDLLPKLRAIADRAETDLLA
jgi:trimethylamine:corrinoid methyltransferase-like protein